VWNFIDTNNDTLILKPNFAIGAKWYAGNVFSTSDTARIDSVYQTTFLGITDSIKSIKVYGNNFTKQILISKNYGIIKFIDINDKYTTLALAGITNPNVGLQNLNGADVFDFQTGDEFHTVYYNHTYLNPGNLKIEEYTKHTIVSSIANSLGITIVDSMYKVKKTYQRIYINNVPIETNTTNDTTTIQTNFYPITLISLFDKLSAENIIDSMICGSGNDSCVNTFIQGFTDGFQTKTTALFGCDFIYNGANSCLFECIVDGIPNRFYTKKMGGGYYHLIPNWNLGFGSEYHPVFHKRGNVEEGTPIDFLSILLGMENKKNQSSIILYPNPANDIITISNIKAFREIEIYNAVGLLVMKTQLQQINISNLATGSYYIKIFKNDNTFVEKRFVKQ
jgi:hypothetical protein